MLTLSHYYTPDSEEEFDVFLTDPFFSRTRRSLLIQIFSSLTDQESLRTLIQKILLKVPDAVVIGSSTSGEIHEGKMVIKGVLICASSFDATSLKTYQALVDDPYESGKSLAEALISPKTKCIIAFADGMMVNGERFLEGVNAINNNHIPIAGGMSADAGRFVETYAFCGNNIAINSVVGVALESDVLQVAQEYNLSWKPIGREMKVTKSLGNCVYEIDDKPIMQMYRDFLGEEVIANIPSSAIEFPLIIEEDGISIARSMIGKNLDDSIIFAGEIKEGKYVRFGIGSIQMLEKQRSANFTDLSHSPSESIFIYSCTARKGFLGKTLEAEFYPLTKIAPVNGFFTYGEFYSSHSEGKLLNITTTILSLSESLGVKPAAFEFPKISTSGLTTNALLHLVDRVVTDLQNYEKENIQIRRSLEELQNSINKVLIVSKTDAKGMITHVNPLFCQISGFDEAELIGKSHNIIRHPDTPKEIFADMWQTIRSGNIWSGELRNRKKNGDSYYVKSFIIPIHGHDGEIEEYLAIREDITGMVEAQNALLKEQAFLQGVMDSQENIVMISANRELKKLNKKFFELFPYANLKVFLSKHHCICDLFIDKEGYLKKPEDGGTWYDDVILYPHRTHKALMVDRWGRELIFAVKLRELYFDTTLYQIVTLNDITQIELAKIAADEAKNSRSEFLATMSHEIRTPMNGIIGFVDLLKETDLNQEQKKYIDIVSNSSKTLLGIINEILDFSKIESGKMEIILLPTDLPKEMHNLYALFEANASSKSIDYRIEVDDSISTCLNIDVLRLKQILGNLVGNAIKFTPEKGKVDFKIAKVKKSKETERIKFEVIDNGVGIPVEKQEKIFEAFSQADSSTTREFGGTGLGLAISAKLAAMMGSTLQVESIVGKGSVFCFELDCSICGEIIDNEEKTQSLIVDGSKTKILVAEDYEINRILMSELLGRFGIEPDFVDNGSAAVDKVKENDYDLVLMDINMPIMDGIEATRFIRRENGILPIIALTANVMEGDKEKFIRSGMNDYLSKPIDFDELRNIIHKYTTQHCTIEIEHLNEIEVNGNPIDHAQKELGLDRRIIEKLFAQFFAKIDADIEIIVQAMHDENYDTIVDMAHKIRGSTGNMRLAHLSEIAKELEQTPREMMKIKGEEYLDRLKYFIRDAKIKAGYGY